MSEMIIFNTFAFAQQFRSAFLIRWTNVLILVFGFQTEWWIHFDSSIFAIVERRK